MEDKHTIAYKQWLESLNEPAPEGAWESIADQLDIDQAWEGIAESLDIDDVWNQVEQNLPQPVPAAGTTPTHLPKVFWAAAIIALFTLTTPVADQAGYESGKEIRGQQDENIPSPRLSDLPAGQAGTPLPGEKGKGIVASGINNEKQQPVTAVPADAKSQLESQQQAVKPAKIGNTNEVKQAGSVKSTKTEQKTSTTQIPVRDVASAQSESTLKQVVPAAGNQSPVVPVGIPEEHVVLSVRENQNAVAGLAQLIQPDSIQSEVKADSTERLAVREEPTDSVREEKPVRSPRWQVGLTGAVKNTWLINPETSNGLKRESLTSTKVTWGKEFGAVVQCSVGRKSFIQAEYYFYSEIGQRYQEYIDALYQTKDIRLEYQKLQLVYRARIFETRKLPPLYAAAGLHASKLSVASTSVGGEGQVVTEEYMPWDYGVLAGLESEFFLTERIILVPGIRASYGMRNIYGGNTQSPANLNKTNTATIGFSLALKYSFD